MPGHAINNGTDGIDARLFFGVVNRWDQFNAGATTIIL
jgi:hypothetical protein